MGVLRLYLLIFCGLTASTRAENLFSSTTGEGQRLIGRGAQPAEIIRSRYAKLDSGTSWFNGQSKDAPTPAIVFNLFGDTELTAVLERSTSPSDGRSVIRGHIQGVADSYFLLACESNVIAGTIFLPDRGVFRIQYAGNGLHQVMEIDPAKVPRCGVEASTDAAAILGSSSKSEIEKGLAFTSGVTLTVVDVLVLYTDSARDAAGGNAGINTLIDLAVAEANLVYENSKVNLLLRLVQTAKVPYADSGDLVRDISRMVDPRDGYLDDVSARRGAVNADLVCLLVENSTDLAGIATQTASATNAFSVVQRRYAVGQYVFAHELAHNFGCQHDRQNASSAGAYADSYGWYFQANFTTYGTVMSYVGQRIPHFSNPNVTFASAPTGVVSGTNAANNAQTLRLRMPVVSAFSGTTSTTITPTVSLLVPTNTTYVGSNFLLTAIVPNGASRVEFYQNEVLVGASSGPSFSFLLTNIAFGNWNFTAKAINNVGAGGMSEPVPVFAGYANDRFALRQSFTGTDTAVNFCNRGATLENGEPIFGNVGYATVWFTWKAPNNGNVMLSIPAHDFAGYVRVYTGNELTNLNLVVTMDLDSPTVFPVTKDVSYQIVVGNYNQVMNEGCATMLWQEFSPITNDDFSNAVPISGAVYHTSANNLGTTVEPGEPVHFSNGGQGHSVWWRWTAVTNGELRVSATGPNIIVAPYIGASVSNLTPVARSGGSVTFSVVSGATYRLAVDNLLGGYFSFDLDLDFTPGTSPANDDFANRELLTGNYLTFSGTTFGATREFGEPYNAGDYYGGSGRSVWWTWTAPNSCRLALSAEHSGARFEIYTGTNVSSLTQVGGAVVDATAGTTYHIKLDSAEAPFTTALRLEAVARIVASSNNGFASRAALGSSSIAIIESNAGANKEPGEPNHGNNPGGQSVWFTWTAPNNGIVKIRVEGGGQLFYPLLGVYSGMSLNELVHLGQAAFAYPYFSVPEVTLNVTNGTTLQIAVDAYNGFFGTGAIGEFVLGVEFTRTAPNDLFANRIPIIGTNATVWGTNTAATLEDGEPAYYGWSGKSVWWTWTAPHNSTVTLTTSGSSFNPQLAVYAGDSIAGLSFVNNGASQLWFKASAGVAYQIAVDGSGGSGGTIKLNLTSNFIPPPVNDNFSSASVLPGASGSVAAVSDSASAEPGEPGLDANTPAARSMWWTWQAPGTGRVVFRIGGGNIYSWLAAYTGSSLANLQRVGFTTISGPYLSFPVVAGTLYRIKVDGNECAFSVNYDFSAYPANDNFANRIVLSGDSATGTADNIYATSEPSEPNHAGNGRGRSVWWSWTAPRTMWTTVTSGTFAAVAVYTGSALNALTLRASNPNGDPFSFNAAAGVTYQIAVDSGSICGSGCHLGSITISGGPSNPTNDLFQARTPITENPTVIEAYQGAATTEPGEPVLGTGHTLWWSWTAPGRGVTRIHSTSADTVLQVFTGNSLTSLIRLATNSGEVVFPALPGVNYQISVDKIGPATAGMVQFSLSEDLVGDNDNFINRIAVGGTNLSFSGTNFGATSEPGETLAGVGRTLWWTWTPPITGRVTVSPEGSVVQVFEGDSLSNLVRVAYSPWNFNFTAGAGKQYHLSQDAAGINATPLSFSLVQTSGPPNDLWANATVISGPFVLTNVFNTGATIEPGEPRFDDPNSTATIWWKWTAPETRWMSLRAWGKGEDFAGAAFDIHLGVYSGNSVSNLALIGCSTNLNSFLASAGTTYYIAADGKAGALGIINLRLNPTPLNDRFADRRLLNGYYASVNDSSLGAQLEPGETGHYIDPSGASVWFTWVAPASGNATITYTGADFFPAVAVYTGTALTNLVTITAANFGHPANFLAEAGTTYQIAMAAWYGADGNYTFNLSLNGGKTNDNFAKRIALLETNLILVANNTGATIESGEPSLPGYAASHSLWWAFVAPTNGSVRIDFTGIGFPPLIGVYTGTSLATLIPVTNVTDYFKQQCVFNVVVGTNYLISVDGYNGATGDIQFQFDFLPAPVNDHFSNRIILSGNSMVMNANNRGATAEASEPKHAGLTGGHSLWWSWTAPASETVTLKATGDGFSPRLAIYQGLGLGTLKPLFSNYTSQVLSDHITFVAAAGTNYQIAVDSAFAEFGSLSLAMTPTPRPINDEFMNASVLTGSNPTAIGNNLAGGVEPGEPTHAGFPACQSVWWRWVAGVSGPVTIDTRGSTFDTLLAVYTGSALSNLVAVAANDDEPTGGATSRVTFDAVAGSTCFIAVDGFANSEGHVQLNLRSTIPPPVQFSDIKILGEGTLMLSLLGTPTQIFTLEKSTNLVDWQTVSTNQFSGLTCDLLLPTQHIMPKRFYRTKLWP